MLVGSGFGFAVLVRIPVRGIAGLVREDDVALAADAGVGHGRGGRQRVDDDLDGRLLTLALCAVVVDGGVVRGGSVHRLGGLVTLTGALKFTVVPFHDVARGCAGVEGNADRVVRADR